MHLRTLELFCTIAEQRSFSKAATAHQLTQSAVSQAMQHLEESLGVQLIDRSKRPLKLTTAGKTYLRGIRGVLRSYQRLEQEVRSISKQLSGQISIGTIVSVGLSYMPEATEAFARIHPEVEVQAEFGSNDRVFEMTSGTKPYRIYLNGMELFQTNSNMFNVDAAHGDIISVSSKFACEGKLEERISKTGCR